MLHPQGRYQPPGCQWARQPPAHPPPPDRAIMHALRHLLAPGNHRSLPHQEQAAPGMFVGLYASFRALPLPRHQRLGTAQRSTTTCRSTTAVKRWRRKPAQRALKVRVQVSYVRCIRVAFLGCSGMAVRSGGGSLSGGSRTRWAGSLSGRLGPAPRRVWRKLAGVQIAWTGGVSQSSALRRLGSLAGAERALLHRGV